MPPVTNDRMKMAPRSNGVRQVDAHRRIALFNVKFSPNLGDGLLSECLELELMRSLPGTTVQSVDLAGRTAYPQSSDSVRGTIMAVLDRMPKQIRRSLSWLILETLLSIKLRRHYRHQLRGVAVAVVGGGNLFSDTDLNFPMKVGCALDQAAKLDLPVAVFGVGVLPNWSRKGAALFGHSLAASDIVYAAVRDRQSQDAWARQSASFGVGPAAIVVDPGVLASLHFERGEPSLSGRKIGFCVTNPLAVRYHSDEGYSANLDQWYGAALRSLVEADFEVALFTNGSPEDRSYLHAHYREWIQKAKGPVALVDTFAKPADLTSFVSGCDGIIGHRMHACIAAYSFGVPALGLKWDVKLDSFFEAAHRLRHIVDPSAVPASDVGRLMEQAVRESFDPHPLIAQSQLEIAGFAAVLGRCGRQTGA